MIEHLWTILCSQSIINQKTNNVTLVEVIEQLRLLSAPPHPVDGKYPILSLNLELVSSWGRVIEAREAKGRARWILSGPSAEDVLSDEYEIDLSTAKRHRRWTALNGLPFLGEGRYRFRIELWDEEKDEWRRVAETPLQVSIG